MKKSAKQKLRRLVVILGDQLDPRHPLIEALDPECDLVFMAEVREESTHVWSHKARIVLFLAAMRHYRDSLRARGITVRYLRLDAHCHQSLAAALNAVLQDNPPQQIAMLQAGDARVQSDLEATARQANLPLEVIEDPHFLVTATAFSDWLAQRKQPRLEHFYRALRKQTGLLMQDAAPLGGRWNFDADNRASFGKQGPVQLPLPPAFSPDRTTREVLAQAIGADACPFTTLYWDFLSRHQERFAHHPRMALQWRNLQRIDTESLRAIRPRAESLRALF